MSPAHRCEPRTALSVIALSAGMSIPQTMPTESQRASDSSISHGYVDGRPRGRPSPNASRKSPHGVPERSASASRYESKASPVRGDTRRGRVRGRDASDELAGDLG
jgi:hypothetical protein